MYEIIFDKKALEQLNKFEKNIKERIWNKLQLCKENPFRFLEALIEIEGFKLRVGDYRVIIDIDYKNKMLKVIKVGHRRNIYER